MANMPSFENGKVIINCDLKSLAFRGVPVQVWPRAPFKLPNMRE